jgi:3-isopropylmalate dehydrogenase
MTYRLAVIAGDGVGREVTEQALHVLQAAGDKYRFDFTKADYDLGGRRYLATGEVLPESVEDELAEHDAILLGAVGTPEVPPGVLERGLLLKLRFDFDLYVNLRPVKLYPGVPTPIAGLTPDRCDLVVVRENTEGLYVGGRRHCPPRYRSRDRHPGVGQYSVRHRTSHPIRLRAGYESPEEADPLPQDERPHLRR